jgi:hypothetical protein
MIDMLKNSIDRYRYFDAKYAPNRHDIKIAEIEERIRKLKEKYDGDCTCK